MKKVNLPAVLAPSARIVAPIAVPKRALTVHQPRLPFALQKIKKKTKKKTDPFDTIFFFQFDSVGSIDVLYQSFFWVRGLRFT